MRMVIETLLFSVVKAKLHWTELNKQEISYSNYCNGVERLNPDSSDTKGGSEHLLNSLVSSKLQKKYYKVLRVRLINGMCLAHRVIPEFTNIFLCDQAI